jgi:membrane protein DedA with SNARE-associated domain
VEHVDRVNITVTVNALIRYVIRYGIPLIFINVFAEQIGAPIPAVPTLIVAGALSRDGKISSTYVLLAAIFASLIADYIWFLLGRFYGYRVLRTLCRISLSPDSCVRDTEAHFERWGLKSLAVAKFIPGFSTVAPPLAGAMRASTLGFLAYDFLGAVLWAVAAVAAGRAFHRAIDRVLLGLENLGWGAVVFVASAVGLVVLVKFVQRQRFYRQLRMARVTADELQAMLKSDKPPVVLDVRAESTRKRDPRRIPNAITATIDDVGERLADYPPHHEIVLYCT